MSERRRIVYDDFSGGNQGHLNEYQAGRMNPIRYEGENLVYDRRTGGLAQRPAAMRLKTTAHTGHTCVGMGFAGTTGADIWYALRRDSDGQVRIVMLGSVSGTEYDTGTLGVLAADEVVLGVETHGSRTFIVVPGIDLYYLDHVAHTITNVAGTLGGHAIGVYGDRLYVGGVSSVVTNRVYYSDALDFDTFGALSFFDVGHGPEVRFLAEQRGHLTIGLQDGTWWVLNGLVDDGGVLRRVSGGGVHPWHFYGAGAVQLGDDRIAFVPIDRDWPAFFDGSRLVEEVDRSIDDSEFGSSAPDQRRYVAVRGVEPDEVIFRSGDTPQYVFLNRRGAWTQLWLDFAMNRPFMASDGQGYLFLAGLNGTTFAVFRLLLTDMAPAYATGSEVAEDVGTSDPPYAWLYLPEWWESEGRQVMVRSVTVDYLHRWQGDVGDFTSNLSCFVEALLNITGAGIVAHEASDYLTRTPVVISFIPGSTTFNFGEQGHGRGFRVYLDDIEGISIRRVTVDVMVDDPVSGR